MQFSDVLGAIHDARAGLSERELAVRAGVRPETLSRLKRQADCDLRTLSRLLSAVRLRTVVVPDLDKAMPEHWTRQLEEALLDLCATSLDVAAWLAAGPRYFMAGVAMLAAQVREREREALTVLAEALYPGMSTVTEFQAWLDRSPIRSPRFLPQLRQRLRREPHRAP